MVSEVWVKRFGRNEETWSVGDKTFNVQRKKILCKLILPGFFLNIKVLVLNVSTIVFLMLNCIRANFRRQNIFALPFLLEKRREKRKTSSSFFTYTLNIGKHNCMVCGVYEAFFRDYGEGGRITFWGWPLLDPAGYWFDYLLQEKKHIEKVWGDQVLQVLIQSVLLLSSV